MKIILKNVRLSYANVWEPKSINGSEPKYSTSILVSKDDKDNIEKIQKAVETIRATSAQKWGGKIPATLKMPLRDGDVEKPDVEDYRGHCFINANSKQRPGIVDAYMNPITDTTQVYSGCYVNISVTLYPFNVSGNKGIACGLNNIQKVRDGANLSGRPKVTDDFEVEECDSLV